MTRSPKPSRTDCKPSERFNKRLHMYSLAAGAAGVGLLSFAKPATGEIIYTPANVVISPRVLHSYSLDLNHDGTTDFFLNASARQSIDMSGGTSQIIAKPALSNAVEGYGGNAAALKTGQTISSGRKFSGRFMASLFTFLTTELHFHGRWAKVANRYLGLKFQIDGQTHFGWARLSVGGNPLTAKLTGYAYETTANASIIAGETASAGKASLAPGGEPGSRAHVAPMTLGQLALGVAGLTPWRREQEGVA